MGNYSEKYDKLNTSEKYALGLRPLVVGAVKDQAEKALAEAQRRFPPSSLHNGEGDAFRHCYWSALMTRDIGVLNTLAITNAHEDFPGNPEDEKKMDLHNNAQGIMVGVAHKKASDEELADLCVKLLRSGRLIVLNR